MHVHQHLPDDARDDEILVYVVGGVARTLSPHCMPPHLLRFCRHGVAIEPACHGEERGGSALQRAGIQKESFLNRPTLTSTLSKGCNFSRQHASACATGLFKYAAHRHKCGMHMAPPHTCPAAGSELLKACLLLAHAVEGHKRALQGRVKGTKAAC